MLTFISRTWKIKLPWWPNKMTVSTTWSKIKMMTFNNWNAKKLSYILKSTNTKIMSLRCNKMNRLYLSLKMQSTKSTAILKMSTENWGQLKTKTRILKITSTPRVKKRKRSTALPELRLKKPMSLKIDTTKCKMNWGNCPSLKMFVSNCIDKACNIFLTPKTQKEEIVNLKLSCNVRRVRTKIWKINWIVPFRNLRNWQMRPEEKMAANQKSSMNFKTTTPSWSVKSNRKITKLRCSSARSIS